MTTTTTGRRERHDDDDDDDDRKCVTLRSTDLILRGCVDRCEKDFSRLSHQTPYSSKCILLAFDRSVAVHSVQFIGGWVVLGRDCKVRNQRLNECFFSSFFSCF
jgi:hypothetical protein